MSKAPLYWQGDAQTLLNTLSHLDEALPFLEPVNTDLYPDYPEVISTPICIQLIKQKLDGEEYTSPAAFLSDWELMFANAFEYNTNPHSLIITLTKRLQRAFRKHSHTLSQHSTTLSTVSIPSPKEGTAKPTSPKARKKPKAKRDARRPERRTVAVGDAGAQCAACPIPKATLSLAPPSSTPQGSLASKTKRRQKQLKLSFLVDESSNNSVDHSAAVATPATTFRPTQVSGLPSPKYNPSTAVTSTSRGHVQTATAGGGVPREVAARSHPVVQPDMSDQSDGSGEASVAANVDDDDVPWKKSTPKQKALRQLARQRQLDAWRKRECHQSRSARHNKRWLSHVGVAGDPGEPPCRKPKVAFCTDIAVRKYSVSAPACLVANGDPH
eukprot:m.106478 g.106478  ORF g.106478 m.106478 type:complete len:384 (-) comp13301_c0_seq2:577-1728(-)